VVAAGSEAKASRPPPPPLMTMRGAPWPWRVRAGIPAWAWLLLVLLPPCAVLLRRLRGRRRTGAVAPRRTESATLDAEIDGLVRTLAPGADAYADAGLVAALRAVGLDQTAALRLVAVRDRLRELRYGPAAGPVPSELRTEAGELLETLRPRTPAHRGVIAASAILVAAIQGIAPARAQAPDPTRLYAAGSLRAASSGFLRELERNPRDPAVWYNLGATYYRLGMDGRAAAAWLQAQRLAPRNRTIGRALALAPPPDAGSATRLWSPPVSWPELALAALPLWAAGWLLLAWRPRRRDVAVGLLVLGVLVGGAGAALCAREMRPVAIVLGATPLQLSPHERAPTIAPLEPGSAVLLLRRQAGWSMVNAPGGRIGWIPLDSAYRLRNL
jgi:hypothetical protein